jgi:hypothetical protein
MAGVAFPKKDFRYSLCVIHEDERRGIFRAQIRSSEVPFHFVHSMDKMIEPLAAIWRAIVHRCAWLSCDGCVAAASIWESFPDGAHAAQGRPPKQFQIAEHLPPVLLPQAVRSRDRRGDSFRQCCRR